LIAFAAKLIVHALRMGNRRRLRRTKIQAVGSQLSRIDSVNTSRKGAKQQSRIGMGGSPELSPDLLFGEGDTH